MLTPTLIATEGLTRIVWYSSFGMEMGAHKDVGVSLDNLDYHKPEKETQRYILSKTGAWALGIEHNRHYKAQGVASVPIDPGNVISGLPRDQALQLRIVAKIVCYPTVYGAYTALYAGFSPDVVSDQADWTKEWGECGASRRIRGRDSANLVRPAVAPFGRMFPLRPDLTNATLLEKDGGNGGTAKFWDWCEEQIKDYV